MEQPSEKSSTESSPAGTKCRLTFTEEVKARLETAIAETMAAVPELQGVAVALVWRSELHTADPHGLVLGNFSEPSTIAAAAIQLAKLQRTLTERISRLAHEGYAALDSLQKEINDRQQKVAGGEPGEPGEPGITDDGSAS